MMTIDVFISYNHNDKAAAKRLARLLKRRGFNVWWDNKIPVGKTWADVIEEKLKAAKAVVVLWSSSSVNSRWVKKEARWGLNHNILLPALIEAVTPPFEFEDVQAARLQDWNGDPDDENLQAFVDDIVKVVGSSPRPRRRSSLTQSIPQSRYGRWALGGVVGTAALVASWAVVKPWFASNGLFDLPNPSTQTMSLSPDTARTKAGERVVVDVLFNDRASSGSDLRLVEALDPQHGSATLAGDRRSLVYEPDAGFSGSDVVRYVVTDGRSTDTSELLVTVVALAPLSNRAPTARDDDARTSEGVPVVVQVLANDADPDGDSLQIVAIMPPRNGFTDQTPNGAGITYMPMSGFSGTDRFRYVVTDGSARDTATVTVLVDVRLPVSLSGQEIRVVYDAGSESAAIRIEQRLSDLDAVVILVPARNISTELAGSLLYLSWQEQRAIFVRSLLSEIVLLHAQLATTAGTSEALVIYLPGR